MNPLSSAELAGMRATQVESLMDTCVIQRHKYTANGYNEQVSSWTDDLSTTQCGLDMRAGSERFSNRMAMLNFDATARLPITVSVDEKDRIKVTKRYGETLSTALVFDIAGPIQRGPSGIRLLLRRVEL